MSKYIGAIPPPTKETPWKEVFSFIIKIMEHIDAHNEQPERVYSRDDCNAIMAVIRDVIDREYNDGGIWGISVQTNSWEEASHPTFRILSDEYYPTLIHILQEYMPDDMIRQTRIFIGGMHA
jgi:hypothetical protein